MALSSDNPTEAPSQARRAANSRQAPSSQPMPKPSTPQKTRTTTADPFLNALTDPSAIELLRYLRTTIADNWDTSILAAYCKTSLIKHLLRVEAIMVCEEVEGSAVGDNGKLDKAGGVNTPGPVPSTPFFSLTTDVVASFEKTLTDLADKALKRVTTEVSTIIKSTLGEHLAKTPPTAPPRNAPSRPPPTPSCTGRTY